MELIQEQIKQFDCFEDEQVFIKLHNLQIMTISKDSVTVFRDLEAYQFHKELLSNPTSTDEQFDDFFDIEKDNANIMLLDITIKGDK
jgi:hypothetical protein